MRHYAPTRLSENIRETPEGFLLCVGVPIARTGEQIYAEGETPLECGDDGKIIIYRDAEEVFHIDTIASYEGKAVTIKHPKDFVSPDNWSYLAKGIVQNVRRSGEKDEEGNEILLADLLITDALAIQLVKAGLREVSCGYDAEYEQIEKGKGRQKGIVGNHLALVEEGRAGPTYAINDHKGEGSTMSKLAEKMKSLFAKAVDEAVESEKKEEKAKDESAEKKEEPKKEEKAKDAGAYDELMNMVKDLGSKLEAMASMGKDEKEEPKKEEPKKEEEKAKDEEAGESSMESRLKAVEMALAKLLEKESAEAGDDGMGNEEEESEDEAEEEEESDMTGDTAERVEILSPGLKPSKGVDIKVKALMNAYQAAETKGVVEGLTGGKAPVFDSAEKVEHLFIATSEILKRARGNGLEKTKTPGNFQVGDSKEQAMTPEKMNEINARVWAQK